MYHYAASMDLTKWKQTIWISWVKLSSLSRLWRHMDAFKMFDRLYQDTSLLCKEAQRLTAVSLEQDVVSSVRSCRAFAFFLSSSVVLWWSISFSGTFSEMVVVVGVESPMQCSLTIPSSWTWQNGNKKFESVKLNSAVCSGCYGTWMILVCLNDSTRTQDPYVRKTKGN